MGYAHGGYVLAWIAAGDRFANVVCTGRRRTRRASEERTAKRSKLGKRRSVQMANIQHYLDFPFHFGTFYHYFKREKRL